MDNDIKLVVDAVYIKPLVGLLGEFYGNVRYVFQIVDSCLVRNFGEYLSSNYEMVPRFFTPNSHNYGMCLPGIWTAMCSLPYEKTKLLT